VERIDAHIAGVPASLADMFANADRRSGSVTLMLPQETIEAVDAFRAALGLKSRAEAIRRLLEDGLRAKLS
jgi:Ribbon-helix-helix protein, copG family